MAGHSEETSLIKKAQSGDSAAFGELIIRHERFVYNVVYRMLPNKEDAEDISQEVFLKVYKYLGKFDGKASFSTWVYKIAVNTCIDEIRKRKGKETLSINAEADGDDGVYSREYADSGMNVEEEVLSKEGLSEIKRAIDKLSEEHKTIITLRDIEGLSYTEIAEITDCSMGTVKSRLARARKILKGLIVKEREQNQRAFVR
ncbi:sigma-70 family RNA polymerase sigma factor [Anaerotignum faecicola]|nr:sigma-70 family RNA polymerase sigma factor [Anaerotignum faecicola]